MRTSLVLSLALFAQACGTDPCADPLSAPATFTFEPGELGVTARDVLRVASTCTDAVTVTSAAVTGDDHFAVEDVPGEIPKESEGLFSVAFTPDDYTPRLAELTVETSHGTATVVLVGRASTDQDGDGFDAVEAGGTDCDDTDDQIGERAEEEFNGRDDDCDGLVDEGFVTPGDVLITELMLTPKAVSPEVGQWVEVTNVSSNTKDLTGWTLSGTAGTLRIPAGIRLSAGQSAVIGFEADTTKNGGVELDGVFEGDGHPLPSQGFQLALAVGERPIAMLVGYRWPEEAGSSIALDGMFVDPLQSSTPATWCASSTPLASGDRGTPGAANDPCPQFDHDGDGISPDDGDCDDTDRGINPNVPEVWDGVDQDCDGYIDQLQIGVAEGGQLRGRFTFGRRLAVGDWNGDGKPEALVTGGTSNSRLYRTDPATFMTENVHVDDVGLGIIHSTGNELGRIEKVAAPADVDGDGDTDVLVVGRTPAFYGGSTDYPYGWVFDSMTEAGEEWTTADARIWFADPRTGVGGDSCGAVTDADLDGDGTNDVVIGAGSYGGSTEAPSSLRGRIWLLDLHDVVGEVVLDEDALAVYTGTREGTTAGEVVSGGDVDNDGYDDLIVTDLTAAEGETRRVQILPGAAELPEEGALEDLAALTIVDLPRPGNNAEDVGPPLLVDIDGDEALDLVVPDPWGEGVLLYYDAKTLEGEVDSGDADQVLDGPAAFGMEVSWGDVGGDGTKDLLVGAPAHGGSGPSYAFLFSADVLGGTGETQSTEATVSFRTDRSGDLGSHVILWDLDGDGSDEFVFGDPGDSSANGAIFVFSAARE